MRSSLPALSRIKNEMPHDVVIAHQPRHDRHPEDDGAEQRGHEKRLPRRCS